MLRLNLRSPFDKLTLRQAQGEVDLFVLTNFFAFILSLSKDEGARPI